MDRVRRSHPASNLMKNIHAGDCRLLSKRGVRFALQERADWGRWYAGYVERGSQPLLLQENTGILRNLLDEEAHFRLGWLIIRRQPVEGESFCRTRPNRPNYRRAESFVKCLGVAHPFRHEKQVRDLPGVHKENDGDMPMCES